MHDKLPVNSNHGPEIQLDVYFVTNMKIYLNLYLFCISIDTSIKYCVISPLALCKYRHIITVNSIMNSNITYPIYGFGIMV